MLDILIVAKVSWDNDVEVLLEAVGRKRISRVQWSCVIDGRGKVWLLGPVGFLIDMTGSADGFVVLELELKGLKVKFWQ